MLSGSSGKFMGRRGDSQRPDGEPGDAVAIVPR